MSEDITIKENFELEQTVYDSKSKTILNIADEKKTNVHKRLLKGKKNSNNLSIKHKGKYKFRNTVGAGGMKKVVKVEDNDTSRSIAMAILNDDTTNAAITSFVQEAQITANLEHPNIVPIHDIGVDELGLPYFTMKLLKGTNLTTIIKDKKSGFSKTQKDFTLPKLLDILKKICDAIAFAHSKGIVHLDLKPDNIQIGDYGEVLVLDWGLAKFIEKEKIPPHKKSKDKDDDNFGIVEDSFDNLKNSFTQITLDGEVRGTPGFMAPEQAAGANDKKDERTDIYSLGAILYYMLTGVPHIKAESVKQIIEDTFYGNFLTPRDCAPHNHIPSAVESIILKAMKRHPDERYQTITELKNDIDAYLSNFATNAEKAGPMTRTKLFLKRNKVLLLITIILCFAIGGVLFVVGQNQLQRHGSWGESKNITPSSMEDIKKNWTIIKGNWKVNKNKLYAVPGSGDSFEIYYKTPITGNFALEFDAMAMNQDALTKSGDLSVIISKNLVNGDCYYMQLGGINNSSAIIKRKDKTQVITKFMIEPKRTYHIRIEKEKGVLKLFNNGSLVLTLNDIFYLEGGLLGFYTFGSGKRFWNMKLYHKGVPQLISPLLEGDSFYRESLKYSDKIQRLFLRLAKDAYSKVYDSYPNNNLGLHAKLKRAYINIALNDLKEARKDSNFINNRDKSLSQLLLKCTLDFKENKFQQVYSEYWAAYEKYPNYLPNINANIFEKLSQNNVSLMNKELLIDFWRLYAKNLRSTVFRCRNKSLENIKFLEGLQFSLLDCSNNYLIDLNPIHNMSLNFLDIANNRIRTLEPLRGMKLKYLECQNNPIENLDPLRKMPLKTLIITNCKNILSLTPLLNCKQLETLIIPKHIKKMDVILKLPNLKYLDNHITDKPRRVKEFLESF